MNNIELDEELKMLSNDVYKDNIKEKINGWKPVNEFRNQNNGFYARIYQKENSISIVYRGTEAINFNKLENIKDFGNDAQMLFNKIPNQEKDAHTTYLKIKKIYPNAKIIFAGHSLAGSLAQIESARTGCRAVTFNAFGTGKILENMGYSKERQHRLNIKNYVNPNDKVYGANYDKMPGQTFATNTNLLPSQQYLITNDAFNPLSTDINKHYLNNLGSLENAVEITPSHFQPKNNKTPLLKGSLSMDVPFTREQVGAMNSDEFSQNENAIMEQLKQGSIYSQLKDYTGYANPSSGDNKIFTREDIGSMSSEDYSKFENEINAQLKAIGVPTSSELSNSGGTVFVSGYTRDDGTEVRSYYRSAPSK